MVVVLSGSLNLPGSLGVLAYKRKTSQAEAYQGAGQPSGLRTDQLNLDLRTPVSAH